ncbi:peptidase [Mycolicibacterium sp. P1-18]|uniref:neutral zinc metallopeptidase n=1 Tax=Mycolicibacterium sp. P1-18 TaxID=2024615 RepID=UPI0011F35BDD|nr:peptidase [Mycolicibacterium sp. P1-18]
MSATAVLLVIAAAATGVVLTGLTTTTVAGQSTSGLNDPFRVGGLPAVDGPSGPRPDAPAPIGEVANSDGGDADHLALLAANDVEDFWNTNYTGLHGTFRPIRKFLSYDSADPTTPEVCGSSPYGNPNAFFCPPLDLIAWDRGAMVPAGEKYFGPMSVAALMAHEYGHAVQQMAGLVNRRTPTVVAEQQADCFAGTYVRWVAEGHSKRFEVSTGDGLNSVLAAAIAIRDPLMTPAQDAMLEEGHGTALDRITAFQMGFVTGTTACAAIDLDDVDRRRGELPMMLQQDSSGDVQAGEVPVDERTLSTLMEVLGHVFGTDGAPTLSLQSGTPCPDAATTTAPASYCPSTNTVTVDLPALQQMGKVEDEANLVLLQGDNTALSLVTSRYVLALQHHRGVAVDDAAAVLRTACLTGYADRSMADPIELESGNMLQLTAGDVDEAVAGLLTNGRAASDVNGDTIPAGFTRIDAYRSGLTGSADHCFSLYR